MDDRARAILMVNGHRQGAAISRTSNIPFEATQGGKVTLYPEYMRVIEQMPAKAGR